MPAEVKKEIQLEIAHVLFIDIVGYSKLSVKEQHKAVEELNQIVRASEQFQKAEAANRLLKIPTGDGMALVFYTSPEAPVRCAAEISRALKEQPRLQLRMGIHSGPVSGVVDVNERANLTGAGINMAKRIMDCGDAGHILLSRHVAEDLEEYEQWRPLLHDLGTCEVKHGVRVGVVSLYNGEIGKAEVPQKIRLAEEARVLAATRERKAKRRRALMMGGAAVVLAGVGIGGWAWHRQSLASRTATGSHLSNVSDKSVAVLPFENLSTNQENAVFAGGVHREVLLNLAKVSDLKVISRTSVMQYAAGAARNLKQIARELGVSHVVEGSVQRDGDKVRVTAQLIDAATDAPIWAEAYNRELADVFAIQNEIAQKITDQLGAKLSPQERTALANAPTHDLEAFNLYTKAQALMDTEADNLAYAENFTKAVALLEATLKRDPQFVAAYCALSEANTQLYRVRRQKDCAPAKAALKEARRIAPNAGEAHFAEALIIYYCDKDFNRALATLELAARSRPNDSEIFTLRGLLERRLGRWQEALRHFTQAIELNPKNPKPYDQAAGTAVSLRRYDESRRIADAATAAFPAEADGWRAWKGELALDEDGDVNGARQQLNEIRIKDNQHSLGLAFAVPFVERNHAEAERVLAAFANRKEFTEFDIAVAEASIAVATKRVEERRASWAAILAEAAEKIKEKPDYTELTGSALLNAALGNKQEAINLATRAVELGRQDALLAPQMLKTLAVVYTWTGEKDLAFEILFPLVKTPPNVLGAGDLKINPDWDNLRDDPRFNELVAEASKPLKLD